MWPTKNGQVYQTVHGNKKIPFNDRKEPFSDKTNGKKEKNGNRQMKLG